MAKKDELHLLIRSLTRSEKRYVRLFAPHKSEEANYMKLFDAIEAQDVYDETLIKQKFKNEKFTKQLHVTKKYLRDLVLAALRNFHAASSKSAELKQVLQNVELLFSKELYSLCSGELKRAWRLADKYELVPGKIEVIAWERKLVQAQEPGNYKEIFKCVANQVTAAEVLVNNNKHWYAMVAATWKTMAASTCPEELSKAKLKLPKPTTVESEVLAANTAYITYLGAGKSKKAEAQLIKLIEKLETYKERLYENPAAYVSTVNNLCSYFVFRKRPQEALSLINKAKSTYSHIRITTERTSLLKQIIRTYNIELEIFRDYRNDTQPDFGFIAETETFISINKNKIPKEYLLSMWFQLAHIHFTAHNYGHAIRWLNEILNNKFGKIRLDLQKYARMLNVMVHFEQQNYFVLRYFVDSMRRFNKKHHMHKEYDEVICRFIIKASNTPVYEHKSLFANTYAQIFADQQKEIVPQSTLDYIDYKAWMAKHCK